MASRGRQRVVGHVWDRREPLRYGEVSQGVSGGGGHPGRVSSRPTDESSRNLPKRRFWSRTSESETGAGRRALEDSGSRLRVGGLRDHYREPTGSEVRVTGPDHFETYRGGSRGVPGVFLRVNGGGPSRRLLGSHSVEVRGVVGRGRDGSRRGHESTGPVLLSVRTTCGAASEYRV